MFERENQRLRQQDDQLHGKLEKLQRQNDQMQGELRKLHRRNKKLQGDNSKLHGENKALRQAGISKFQLRKMIGMSTCHDSRAHFTYNVSYFPYIETANLFAMSVSTASVLVSTFFLFLYFHCNHGLIKKRKTANF